METLEDFAKNYSSINYSNHTYDAVLSGAKWQEKRMYSEEEVKRFIFDALRNFDLRNGRIELEQWFNEFKK